MYCANCGSILEKEFNFCYSCGSFVKNIEYPSLTSNKILNLKNQLLIVLENAKKIDLLNNKFVHISYFTWVFFNTYLLIKSYGKYNETSKENDSEIGIDGDIVEEVAPVLEDTIEIDGNTEEYYTNDNFISFNFFDDFINNYDLSDYFLFACFPLFIYFMIKKYK
jgi:hypothetical protein